MKGQVLFVFLLLVSFTSFAQTDKKEVREGNKLYKKELYNDAEIAYRRGLDVDSTSIVARFNLGNALYKQKEYGQADSLFKTLADPNLPLDKAKVMHNLGNAALQLEKWQESVDAYKQALRLNPTDDETRTNLAYAQAKLEKEQQQQQQNQDQKKNDENKDDQNQDNKNQDKQDNQQQQQQEQEPKISPQQAQQMLEAMQAKEKDTQEKVKKEKAKAAVKVKTEKNW